jgi:hypothetical protein
MYEECRHIKTSGTRCQSPALKGKAYCFFHFRTHQQRHRTVDHYAEFVAYKFDVPVLEDRAAIQIAISEVVAAMAKNYMDPKRGGKILYGLQLALNGMKYPQEILAPEPVRDLCQNDEGEDIAPEMTVYEEGEELPGEEPADEGSGERERRAREMESLKMATVQEAIAACVAELKRRNPEVAGPEYP